MRSKQRRFNAKGLGKTKMSVRKAAAKLRIGMLGAAALLGMSAVQALAAGDVQAGKAQSIVCSSCSASTAVRNIVNELQTAVSARGNISK